MDIWRARNDSNVRPQIRSLLLERRRIDIRNRIWLSAGVSIWTIRIRTPSMSIVSPSMMIVAARADTGTSRASASA
jgi:hypothetical protein